MTASHAISTGAFALLAAGAAVQATAASVAVELRPRVSLTGRTVSLGDVAYLRSDDLRLITMFAALPLGQAPRSGSATSVSRDSLMRWTRARLRTDGALVAWGGASEVTIESAGKTIAGAALEDTARLALSAWLTQRSKRFSMDAVVAPRDLEVPAGQQELRVRPLPAGTAVTARHRVWVDVFVDAGFVRAVPVDFTVAAYGEGWMTAVGVPRGAAVDAVSLQSQEIDLTQVASSAVPVKLDPASTLRARRNLAAGATVTGADLEPVPAVARGEPVTLVSQDRGLELELHAEALQDGQVGQSVRVRARGAAEPVLAQVVAPGRVRIRP